MYLPQVKTPEYMQGLQRSAKIGALGLVKFIAAVAYHICSSLPVALTQPVASTLADPCIVTSKLPRAQL